jgi:DNA-binding CsgD family transcriptional regulator
MIRILKSQDLFVQYVLHRARLRCLKISKREVECVYYLMRGMTIKQVGRILKLSPRTVEGYVLSIKNRLHCCSRHELIEKILEIS